MRYAIEKGVREAAAMARHDFTNEEIAQRFESCRGKTLGEIDRTGVFSGKPKNKGVAGDVIEQSILGYPADTRQEPDIEIDGIPYEVKTTGLVKSREDDKLVAKEPMSVTAVSVDRIWRERFESSAFWHKLEHLLLAYYLYNNGRNSKVSDTMEYAAFPFLDYELHEWSEEDRSVLKSDWTLVHDFVERVHAEGMDPDEEYPKLSHELNRQLLYTDTSPKWPHSPRWRLKRSTVSALVREHFEGGLEELPSTYASYGDLERACRELRFQFGEHTVEEIANAVGYTGSLKSKSVSEALIVRMFGGTAKKLSKIDVFAKAGITCKTVVTTGGPAQMAEDTKFLKMDVAELEDVSISWDESSAREGFERRVLCAVFSEPSVKAPLRENVFLGFKWIELDDQALDEARRVWEESRRLIVSGALRDVVSFGKDGVPVVNKTGVIRSAPNFPKARGARAVFVRGDSLNSTKKPLVINGIAMYPQYFWLKRSWVADRLDRSNFM